MKGRALIDSSQGCRVGVSKRYKTHSHAVASALFKSNPMSVRNVALNRPELAQLSMVGSVDRPKKSWGGNKIPTAGLNRDQLTFAVELEFDHDLAKDHGPATSLAGGRRDALRH